MCRRSSDSILLSSCVFLVLGSRVLSNDIDKNQNIKQSTDAYIHALEKFDRSSQSFTTLITSMKGLIDAFDTWKADEFSALLWSLPSARRDLFPFTQYRSNSSMLRRGRIDALLQRKDDTMFGMTVCGRLGPHVSLKQAVELFPKGAEPKNFTYRGVTRPISHQVLIGLGYTHPWRKPLVVRASYLLDNLDLSKAVDVTV